MLTLLRKKTAAYVGRHADEDRAPTGTACVDCGGVEPPPDAVCDEDERPLKLTRCSMCEVWRCTTCYSQHALTPPPVAAEVKTPLWKRVIGRG